MPKLGYKQTLEHILKVKLNRTEHYGFEHPNWKGGLIRNGYKGFYYQGKFIFEHRYYMEEVLGRKLTSNEDVHHINGNTLDNRLENLELMTKAGHSKIHLTDRWKNGKMPVKIKSGIYKECVRCGKEIYMPMCRVNDGKDTGKFCSRKCKDIWNANIKPRNQYGQFL